MARVRFSGRQSRRERPLQCGPPLLPRPMKSAAATARTAMSARSYRTMWLSAQAVKAFEGMRSTRTTPRRSGRRARNWSESLSEEEGRNEMREKTKLGGAFAFAGTSLTVNRIGYGAMQLAGRDGDKMVWGPPRDVPGAIAVLREAVASGVNHFDTSDFYGPHVTNQIIKQALHPYPDDLVIVTKV